MIKDRNSEDLKEIERLHQASEGISNVGEELAGQAHHLEQEAQAAVKKTQDLSRVIDQKSYELKQKEQQVIESEREVVGLKN